LGPLRSKERKREREMAAAPPEIAIPWIRTDGEHSGLDYYRELADDIRFGLTVDKCLLIEIPPNYDMGIVTQRLAKILIKKDATVTVVASCAPGSLAMNLIHSCGMLGSKCHVHGVDGTGKMGAVPTDTDITLLDASDRNDPSVRDRCMDSIGKWAMLCDRIPDDINEFVAAGDGQLTKSAQKR
jgi:hypothetical protein